MDPKDIDSLRALLPAGRTLFPYYRNKYGLQLLRYAVRQPTPVAALRSHPVAQLLHKPALKPVLADCGGTLTPAQIAFAEALAECSARPEHYTLSLGVWGNGRERAPQTSRRGTNLVLQLNFSHAHNRAFQRLARPRSGCDPFNYCAHPVLQDTRQARRYTLAWARLDIDFEQDEALIEEIQTDWLRAATTAREFAARCDDAAFTRRYGRRLDGSRTDLMAYHDTVLAPHRAHWDEAMLAAALFFLREELGLRRIWMHSAESGIALKSMRGGPPPVSLYTRLPQRFCFRPTPELPGLLARERQAVKRLRAHAAALLKFTL
ncbi:MAG: hypothetical protein ACK4KV_10990 [Rhodocyclaceae bacterium]